jgi:hypothetical protein
MAMILTRDTSTNYKAMLGKTGDDTYQVPRLDATTHALEVIDFAHHEIHDGSFFCASYSEVNADDGDYVSLYFKTPDTNLEVHMFCQWQSSGAAYFRIREGAVVTANTGTTQAAINRNRRSSNTSKMFDNATTPVAGKVMSDVTLADHTASVAGDKGGLVIYEGYFGAGRSTPGGNRNDDEYILKQNMGYVFEIESDAADVIASVNLAWYERTPKSV